MGQTQLTDSGSEAPLRSVLEDGDPGRRLDEDRASDHLDRARYVEAVGRSLTRLRRTESGTATAGATFGCVLLASALGLVFHLTSLEVADPATSGWLRVFNITVWGAIAVAASGLLGLAGWVRLQARIIEHNRRLGIAVEHQETPSLEAPREAPNTHSDFDWKSRIEQHFRSPTLERLWAFARRHETASWLLLAVLPEILMALLIRVLAPVFASPSAALFTLF